MSNVVARMVYCGKFCYTLNVWYVLSSEPVLISAGILSVTVVAVLLAPVNGSLWLWRFSLCLLLFCF